MASGVVVRDSRLRKNLIQLLILLALLLALLFAYYLLTRPPQLTGESPPDDADFQFLFSIYGFEGDLLSRPSGVCIGPDDRIYVADTAKHRVVVFDLSGRYVRHISGQDLGVNAFQYPVSVAVADDGRVYILSKQDRKLVILDRDYVPIDEIGFPDLFPTSVQVKGEYIYISTDKAILVGTLEGAPVSQIGIGGKGAGQFDLPGGVAIGEDGEVVYVADTLNYRVQAIEADTGTPRWVFGEPLSPESAIRNRDPSRMFGLPAGIALDEMGKLYVVDGTNSEIVVLDMEEGERIRIVGEVGHSDGRFYYPDGIAYGSGGYIAVADKFNDRVALFRVPAPTATPTVPRWLPLALLPLLALLLWLLMRRRTKFVAAPDFITTVIEREHLDSLAEYTKKLYVTPATFTLFEDAFEKPELVKVEPDEDRLAELKERFELDESLNEVLTVIAHGLKGKRVLLTGVVPIRDAADELEIVNLDLDDLIEQGEISTQLAESEAQ